MIIGVGIDVVEINRFAHWHTYSHPQLQRIFSPAEIAYCLEIQSKSAERFAARFAAREALFKALSQAFPEQAIPFLSFCRSVAVCHSTQGAPFFKIDQNSSIKNISVLLSVSHSQLIATAMVAITSQNSSK